MIKLQIFSNQSKRKMRSMRPQTFLSLATHLFFCWNQPSFKILYHTKILYHKRNDKKVPTENMAENRCNRATCTGICKAGFHLLGQGRIRCRTKPNGNHDWARQLPNCGTCSKGKICCKRIII